MPPGLVKRHPRKQQAMLSQELDRSCKRSAMGVMDRSCKRVICGWIGETLSFEGRFGGTGFGSWKECPELPASLGPAIGSEEVHAP